MTYVLRISDSSRVASTIQIERGGYTYETETSLAKAFFFKVHAKVEDCWRSRGDTNIIESAQSYLYALHFLLFYLLLLKEISSILSNTSNNQTTCKDGMMCRSQEGYTYHWTGAEICVSPVLLFSCWRKYRRYHLTQLVTQQGLRQESNNIQR